MKIDPEEFDQWRDNAITRYFFAAMLAYAEDQKQDVIAQAWDGGAIDERTLAERRGQAFSAVYFANAKLEEIEKYHEERK